jgi:alkylated DNA repair dioxygenase AlkB
MLRRVNRKLGTQFSAILVNQYCDGNQSIGAHSDDLRDLDRNHPIASISLGATRTFRIREKMTKAIILDYQHRSGTLLVMEGQFETHFTHEVPKQTKISAQRISFTFRKHTQ